MDVHSFTLKSVILSFQTHIHIHPFTLKCVILSLHNLHGFTVKIISYLSITIHIHLFALIFSLFIPRHFTQKTVILALHTLQTFTKQHCYRSTNYSPSPRKVSSYFSWRMQIKLHSYRISAQKRESLKIQPQIKLHSYRLNA